MVHPSTQNGFTLIELVLVATALAILVFSMAPQDNLGGLYVEAAAQRLEQDLRYARELAVTRNINCGIQFQASGNYLVYATSPLTPVLNPLTQQSFNYNLGNNFPNVNLLNILTTLLVEFDPLGRPILGGGTTLQVGDTQSTISLVVTANTGLVRRL